MFRIRKEQMAVLSEATRASFVRREVARLQTDFRPEIERLRLNQTDLFRIVERTIDRAANYRIFNERDVEMFVNCTMMLGLEFDRDPGLPWAAQILRRKDLTGTDKMSLIDDHLLFSGR